MRRREFIALLGGSVAAWPFSARAQQTSMPLVGVLRFDRKEIGNEIFVKPFLRYMKAIGWEEGRNIRFVFASTEGHNERAPAIAGELVAQNAAVIVTFGDPGIRAAQRATNTVPIVGMTDDMVGSGLAASLARPGGNTTGVSILASELNAKRLEILRDFAPKVQRIAVLADASTISTQAELESVARELGVQLIRFEGQSPDEITRALDAVAAAQVGAVNVLASPLLAGARAAIIKRVRDARLPAIYQWPETVAEGGLLGYGPSIQLCYRQIVSLVDKVLHGAKPADLAIEQPSRIGLAINLKAASELGMPVPPAILVRADEVIE
ncbi:MAG: ABC transporter substrate-binding protein [Xanthobacteraceae bacterium]